MTLQTLLQQKKPLIMGILNLTPDSFSDGGSHTERGTAVHFALRMVRDGADIIDVGGESTRPGSQPVAAAEQIRRVEGVIAALRKTLPGEIPISIDTTRSEVAEAAVAAGASILNDVRAGRDDDRMFGLAARKNLPVILMHMQGIPLTMQQDPHYDDVVSEIRAFLLERADRARQAGIIGDNIVIDPGIGFGKTKEHNRQLIANLKAFVDTGYPVLLGASRKRFLGAINQEEEPRNLVGATCATTVLGVQAGVRIFRVHDVMANRQAADVAFFLRGEGYKPGLG
ncbi:MAG: dihydropteroate synthase [Methylococcaceae bacterium]|nr:dihydropteroate synthase [Methylococcaceae bacterium]